MRSAKKRLLLRKKKIRRNIIGTDNCPRLSVFRGHNHLYAQLIDDENGYTLVYVSTLSPEIKSKLKSTDTITAAQAVGELVARKAVEKGFKKVVFDRGGYLYHGRIKALADSARKAGLEF